MSSMFPGGELGRLGSRMIWGIIAIWTAALAFFAGGLYVLIHFISKYW